MNLQSIEGAAVVPVASVVQGARGRTVFTVDDEGTATARPVEVLAMADGMAAVKGISPGDRVVVEGRQNVRNGTKVVDRSRDKEGKGKAEGGKDNEKKSTESAAR